MGRQNLTVAKERTLHFFDLIYARESLSYVFLKELGLENVICLPDPAFIIESIITLVVAVIVLLMFYRKTASFVEIKTMVQSKLGLYL